jgi:hypothetical protein
MIRLWFFEVHLSQRDWLDCVMPWRMTRVICYTRNVRPKASRGKLQHRAAGPRKHHRNMSLETMGKYMRSFPDTRIRENIDTY